MTKIIDQLSDEAKDALARYTTYNIGIFSPNAKLPDHINKLRVYSISVYDRGTVFGEPPLGISVDAYIKLTPKPIKSFAVLVNGERDDSGNLLGILHTCAEDGYLYKPFDKTNFSKVSDIKYDCTKLIVKLTEPYSFLKGGGRKI